MKRLAIYLGLTLLLPGASSADCIRGCLHEYEACAKESKHIQSWPERRMQILQCEKQWYECQDKPSWIDFGTFALRPRDFYGAYARDETLTLRYTGGQRTFPASVEDIAVLLRAAGLSIVELEIYEPRRRPRPRNSAGDSLYMALLPRSRVRWIAPAKKPEGASIKIATSLVLHTPMKYQEVVALLRE